MPLANPLLHRRSQDFTGARDLGKDDETNILGVGAGLKLDLNLAVEILSLFHFANLREALQNSSVLKMFATILAVQYL